MNFKLIYDLIKEMKIPYGNSVIINKIDNEDGSYRGFRLMEVEEFSIGNRPIGKRKDIIGLGKEMFEDYNCYFVDVFGFIIPAYYDETGYHACAIDIYVDESINKLTSY